jgi:long-chain fatty acid transport protein
MRQFVPTAALVTLAWAVSAAPGQGILLPGAGPVQRSMAGTATATALEPVGALFWNPATISGLPHSEAALGFELIAAEYSLTTSAPGVPERRLRSDGGITTLPYAAVAWKPEPESPWTYGIGLFTLAGGSVNFPGDDFNLATAPASPVNNLVLGPQSSLVFILELSPAVSYQLTDRLAVGGGPTIVTTVVSLTPATFTPPSDDNGDGIVSFPPSTSSRPFFGGGFKLGAYYHATDTLDLGLGFTSQQYSEQFDFNVRDENGRGRRATLQASLPMVVSLGAAYRGIEKTLLAADVRYLDYKNTDLFGTDAGVLGGLGWRDVFAVSVAAERRVRDWLSVRAGYSYNTNPIPGGSAFSNAQLPLTFSQAVTTGVTADLPGGLKFSAAYVHSFETASVGPGLLPGSRVGVTAAADLLVLGFSVPFGQPWRRPGGCDGDAATVACAATE